VRIHSAFHGGRSLVLCETESGNPAEELCIPRNAGKPRPIEFLNLIFHLAHPVILAAEPGPHCDGQIGEQHDVVGDHVPLILISEVEEVVEYCLHR
jgi:hypothetical protein